MYALVVLLGVLACGDVRPRLRARGHRRRAAARGAAALGGGVRGRAGRADVHAQLGAVLRRRLRADVARAAGRRARGGAARAAPRRRDRLRRRDPAVRAVAADARLPGPAHGRAVVHVAAAGATCSACRAGCWARSRSSGCCWRRAPARWSCSTAPAGRLGARGRALLAMGGLFVATVLVAYAASQVSPAWAARYLAVALPPLLLLVAGGLAHAGRLGLVGALLVALIWAGDGAPTAEEQRARDLGGDRPEPEAGRRRRLHPARADPGAQLLPAARACATRRSGARSTTSASPTGATASTACAATSAPQRPRAAARRAAARAADRARRADHQQPRALAGAVDRARARALDASGASTSPTTRG